MFVIAPFFSSGIIPARIRILLAFFLTLVIFPIVTKKGYTVSGNMGLYALMVLQEVIIGIFIGFLASIVFAAFQLSGQYFSIQIGFGISEVMDPLAQVSIPIIGQLSNLIGVLVFLVLNGHHYLINAVYRSYELAPFFSLSDSGLAGMLKFFSTSFSSMFFIALKIAIPIMATIFLVSISMGVLAKVAPQMNILMLGFPFKIIVAFALIALTSPLIVRVMRVSLERTFKFLANVIEYWPA
jgi:flagellar biosynthetic protein FliR